MFGLIILFLWFLGICVILAIPIIILLRWGRRLYIANAKKLLSVKSVDINLINKTISGLVELKDKGDEEAVVLINQLRQLRDNPSSAKSENETVKVDIGEKIFCPKCGKENPTTISICISCGAKLPKEYLAPTTSIKSSTTQRFFPTSIFPSSIKFSKVFWVIFLIVIIATFIIVMKME